MLSGREAERAAVRAVLDAARQGTGGALVVRGVAGAGKSSLLADIAADAPDMRVVRTSGVESESPLAFAALQRLLWPLRSHLGELPAPQREALAVALGEATGEGERFLTFLGTLSLLAEAAEGGPVLAVVDDAHWLDEASAAALLFVARRLQAEPVALLFAARDNDARRFDAPDVPVVTLGGLGDSGAEALLASRVPGGVDPGVRAQLLAVTAGNPLALIELADALDAEQLAGRAPLPAQLPLTGGVERAFLDRYRRLPAPAQTWLLVAAADDTQQLSVVQQAADAMGVGDALDEVERSGLVTVTGDVLALQHPLVRSAIYAAATTSQRRSTHAALAHALDGEEDRRAWHLAAATDRPDEAVVGALDAAAERAVARGGHEAAAAAWARAAELSTGGEARGARLFRAASSAWLGGQPSRAAALASAAARDVTAPALRARLLTLQAQLEWNTRSLNDGYDLVIQAVEAAYAADPAMAGQLAMLAASLAAFGAASPRPFDPRAFVREPAEDAPVTERIAYQLLLGFRALGGQDYATARSSFDAAFGVSESAPAIEDHVLQPNLAVAAWVSDDDVRSLHLHEQQLTLARRAGALAMVEHALTRGFFAHLVTGGWARAAADAAEAAPLAAATGNAGLTALPTSQLALVGALRGEAGAEELVGRAETVRAAHRIGITDALVVDLCHWTRALLAAVHPESALHHLQQLGRPDSRRLAAFDLFDAAVRADRRGVAAGWLTELEAFAAGTQNPSAVAVVEHGRALLADDDTAERHFQRSLDAHQDSPRRPQRARTHLAYGEWLRRARRRVDAREQLRTALAMFEDLGAAPWAERAAAELRASGESARRRDASTAAELTNQEQQVARLVRQGLSNRDVAAQLFVSPRTVDFHLRNVFTKLSITSRAELVAASLEL
ncbi:MAG: helix-turn-helix transcriptional regulator [Actinomycetales bacterium]